MRPPVLLSTLRLALQLLHVTLLHRQALATAARI
jgi:hypothetical protein